VPLPRRFTFQRLHETMTLVRGVRMSTATIEYPSELTAALGKRPNEALQEVKLMAALKLFDSGRISSGLAARLADLSRVQFLLLCGQYGVSVFQQTAEELDSDTEAALHAGRG
jgi:predicted HTH domain antitoxin